MTGHRDLPSMVWTPPPGRALKAHWPVEGLATFAKAKPFGGLSERVCRVVGQALPRPASLLPVLQSRESKRQCPCCRTPHSVIAPSMRKPRRDVSDGASPYHRRSHKSVTNYADSPGPRCPDLLLRTCPGLTWTPMDGLYNLCHVVPQMRRLPSGVALPARSGPYADQLSHEGYLLRHHHSSGARNRCTTSRRRTSWDQDAPCPDAAPCPCRRRLSGKAGLGLSVRSPATQRL